MENRYTKWQNSTVSESIQLEFGIFHFIYFKCVTEYFASINDDGKLFKWMNEIAFTLVGVRSPNVGNRLAGSNKALAIRIRRRQKRKWNEKFSQSNLKFNFNIKVIDIKHVQVWFDYERPGSKKLSFTWSQQHECVTKNCNLYDNSILIFSWELWEEIQFPFGKL